MHTLCSNWNINNCLSVLGSKHLEFLLSSGQKRVLLFPVSTKRKSHTSDWMEERQQNKVPYWPLQHRNEESPRVFSFCCYCKGMRLPKKVRQCAETCTVNVLRGSS